MKSLALRVELKRQLRRRRTSVAFAIVIGVPLLVLAAFELSGSGGGSSQGGDRLSDIATHGGLNFAFFVLFVATQLMLITIVALFAGDTISSEASWGTLRYLLILPVERQRLLRQKAIIAVVLGAIACFLVPLVSFIAGTLAYGSHSLLTTTDDVVPASVAVWRLLDSSVYTVIGLLPVAALALMLSTYTDTPLGAVSGSVGLVVVSNILDAVTSLGTARSLLPTHYLGSWFTLLSTNPDWVSLEKGIFSAACYTLIFMAIAHRHFQQKDILS